MLLAEPISHTGRSAWILSKFPVLYWICLLSILLFLMGVKPFMSSHCSILFSGVKLSIGLSFAICINCRIL